MAKKRKNGEGTWGKKVINGIEYKFFRNSNGKYFYGKTDKEVKEKITKYTDTNTVSDKMTFGEYLDWYYDNVAINTLAKTTYQGHKRKIRLIKESEHFNIADIQLKSFTKQKNYLIDYINSISPHYALNTIKGYWSTIKQAVIYGEDNGFVSSGLTKMVKLPKESNVGHKAKVIPFLSKSDVDKLYIEVNKKCRNGADKYHSAAWAAILIIHTGLRISELRALRWNDIDFERSTLRVDESMAVVQNEDGSYDRNYIKETKNVYSVREIGLNSIAIEMIRKFEKLNKKHTENDFVCITRNKTPVLQQTVAKEIDMMLEQINSEVKHCNVHALRHTFGSLLYEQGVDLKAISTLMGHADISTTANIYIGIKKNQLNDITKIIEPE